MPLRQASIRIPALAILLAAAGACDWDGLGPGVPQAWEEPRRIEALDPVRSLQGFRTMDLTAAPDGSIHLLLVGRSGAGPGWQWTSAYHAASRLNLWSEPFRFAESPNHLFAPRAVGDRQGNLHVLWTENLEGPTDHPRLTHIRYRRLAGSSWGGTTDIRDGIEPFLSEFGVDVDGSGRVNVAYSAMSGLRHMVLSGGEVVADHTTPYHPGPESQVVTRGNVVDIAWIAPAPFDGPGERRSDVLFGSRTGGGSWGALQVVHRNDHEFSHNPRLVVDSRGVRHLVWSQSLPGQLIPERILYARSNDGVTWTEAEEVSHRRSWILGVGLHVDRNDRLHLFYAQDVDTWDARIHYALREDGQWGVAEILFPELGNITRLRTAITPTGQLHAIWQQVVDGPDADFYHAVMR